MTFELAKQLKDAGFPQVMHYKGMGELDGFLERDVSIDNHLIADPSLSELIAGCEPSDKWTLYLAVSGELGKCIAAKQGLSEVGLTPEEAVAKLWLALQPK